MLDIATHESEGGVLQKDIAERQDLSIKYLDHIIRALKKRNLISSVSGRKSGYRLNRKPCEISLYDVYLAFEPELCVVSCLSDSSSCDMEDKCKTKGCWGKLNSVIINYLTSVSLECVMNPKCHEEAAKGKG